MKIIKLSDRPTKPYSKQEIKEYPFLLATLGYKRWELARAILKLDISIRKEIRNIYNTIWKQ